MYLFANIWNVDHEVHSASSEIKYNLKVKVKSLSHVQLFAIPWTIACQAPPSMGFSWQEYWSELPFTSPGDLPNPRIKFIGECTKNLEDFSSLYKMIGQM